MLIFAIAAYFLLSAVLVVFICMLSARMSRREGWTEEMLEPDKQQWGAPDQASKYVTP